MGDNKNKFEVMIAGNLNDEAILERALEIVENIPETELEKIKQLSTIIKKSFKKFNWDNVSEAETILNAEEKENKGKKNSSGIENIETSILFYNKYDKLTNTELLEVLKLKINLLNRIVDFELNEEFEEWDFKEKEKNMKEVKKLQIETRIEDKFLIEYREKVREISDKIKPKLEYKMKQLKCKFKNFNIGNK